MAGTLYLLPVSISDENNLNWISVEYSILLGQINMFVVENIRTARRFLRQTNKGIKIDNLQFIEIGEESVSSSIENAIQYLLEGGNVGLMSESGVPGVADPGAELVLQAHKHNIEVMPIVGPSSIVLVLMGSGLNGQTFTFHGYLPIKPKERVVKIRQIETESLKNNSTQIFIETPYRNQAMFQDLVQSCRLTTLLCLGIDLCGKNQILKTKTIEQWRKQPLKIPKMPAIFAIQAQKT
ncbi:MAG TPA: SAM-dependent methyltransferase [Salinivirgaceae bacterium]|nr:SAM-dependent methyltransferase [Salinivirgaceae bacterium]